MPSARQRLGINYNNFEKVREDIYKQLDLIKNLLNNKVTRNRDTIEIGNQNVDGSWRIIINGNNLDIDRRESGSWVNKFTVEP